MGINVKVSKGWACKDMSIKQPELEKDLESCMRCKYFYGNSNQCVRKDCIQESEQEKRVVSNVPEECQGCPYRNENMLCFPCMRKLLGQADKEK